MPAPKFSLRQHTRFLVLIGTAALLSSCATKQEHQLISAGNEGDSALPWNEQQQWEQTGTLGPLADRLGKR